jgi:hypothetical protein
MKRNRAETNPKDINTTDNLGHSGRHRYISIKIHIHLPICSEVGTSHPLSVGKLILRVETIHSLEMEIIYSLWNPHSHSFFFLNPGSTPAVSYSPSGIYLGKFML